MLVLTLFQEDLQEFIELLEQALMWSIIDLFLRWYRILPSIQFQNRDYQLISLIKEHFETVFAFLHGCSSLSTPITNVQSRFFSSMARYCSRIGCYFYQHKSLTLRRCANLIFKQ